MGGCVSNNQSPRVITTDSAPKHNKDAASKEFSGVESTKNKPSSSPIVTPEPLAAKGDRGSLSSMNRLSLNRHLTLPPLNTQIPPSPTSCTKTIGTKPLIHALSPTNSHDASYRAPYLEVTVNSTNTNASNGGGGSGGRGRHSSDSITKSPTLNPISPSLASRINISPGKRPPTPTFRALSILPTSPKNGAMNSKLQGNPSPSNKNSLPAELLALRTRHLRSSSLPEMQLQDLKCFQATSPKSPHRSPQLLKVNSNDEQEMEAAETKVVEPMSPNGAQVLLSRRKSIANLQIKPFDGLLDSVKVKGKSRITQRRASECGMSIPIMPLESMKTFHALTSATLASSTSSDSNTQEKEETKSTNLFGGVGNSKSPPLASIFDEYAVGAERMKYRHVLHLCNDLIDAFIEGYRQRVEKELKEKSSKTGEIPSSKSIETQMNIDLPYMLGDGVHKDKTKWVEIAARRMWKLLDFNNEGFVSKKKFIARFMKSCEEVLNVNQLKKLNGVQDGNMKDPCMIM